MSCASEYALNSARILNDVPADGDFTCPPPCRHTFLPVKCISKRKGFARLTEPTVSRTLEFRKEWSGTSDSDG
jgi:hypothetical protein